MERHAAPIFSLETSPLVAVPAGFLAKLRVSLNMLNSGNQSLATQVTQLHAAQQLIQQTQIHLLQTQERIMHVLQQGDANGRPHEEGRAQQGGHRGGAGLQQTRHRGGADMQGGSIGLLMQAAGCVDAHSRTRKWRKPSMSAFSFARHVARRHYSSPALFLRPARGAGKDGEQTHSPNVGEEEEEAEGGLWQEGEGEGEDAEQQSSPTRQGKEKASGDKEEIEEGVLEDDVAAEEERRVREREPEKGATIRLPHKARWVRHKRSVPQPSSPPVAKKTKKKKKKARTSSLSYKRVPQREKARVHNSNYRLRTKIKRPTTFQMVDETTLEQTEICRAMTLSLQATHDHSSIAIAS